MSRNKESRIRKIEKAVHGPGKWHCIVVREIDGGNFMQALKRYEKVNKCTIDRVHDNLIIMNLCSSNLERDCKNGIFGHDTHTRNQYKITRNSLTYKKDLKNERLRGKYER
jgi:hypothetical protein